MSAEEALFLPYSVIDSYFREHDFLHLNKILDVIFTEDPPIDAETILRTCPRTLCILLSIGQARFIHHFTQYESLYDQKLPFDPRCAPADFPKSTSDDRFFENFCASQWKFCVKPVSFHAGLRIPRDQILPIKKIERRAGGSSAAVYEIVLYEEYNKLKRETSNQVRSKVSISSAR